MAVVPKYPGGSKISCRWGEDKWEMVPKYPRFRFILVPKYSTRPRLESQKTLELTGNSILEDSKLGLYKTGWVPSFAQVLKRKDAIILKLVPNH